MRWIRQFWICSIYRMKYVYFDGESMEPLKIFKKACSDLCSGLEVSL